MTKAIQFDETALKRLAALLFDDEALVAEIEAMTPEEVDAELRAYGYDPDEIVAEVRQLIEQLKAKPLDISGKV